MKRILKWVGIGFGAIIVLTWIGIFFSIFVGPSVPSRTVLYLSMSEPIPEATPQDFSAIFSDQKAPLYAITSAIRRAATDDRVKGLVLEIKGPSLGFAQILELEQAMAVFRESGKYNVAFMETAGELSRGNSVYATAVVADKVVLAPPGDLNLVGLRAETPFLKKTFDKLNIGVRVEKRKAYKNAANMFTEEGFTPEHREAIVAILDGLQTELVKHIAQRRDKDETVVTDWVKSGPHSAKKALEGGMVDELAYWDVIGTKAKQLTKSDEAFLNIEDYIARIDPPSGTGNYAFIVGSGQIVRGGGDDGMASMMGSDAIASAFRAARKDEVKGVLFRVDSPGGSYIASDVIRREVEITQEAGIPVIISMGNLAASGGYFVSMDADVIVAQPTTITGSIGVFAAMMETRKFFERWFGVTWDVYETDPNAASFSSLDRMPDAQAANLTAAIDRIYADFVGKVAKSRELEAAEAESVAQGRVWLGRQALELKLVDALGGLPTAIEHLKKRTGVEPDEAIRLQLYPQPKSGVELLMDLANVRAPALLRKAAAAIAQFEAMSNVGIIEVPSIPNL